MTSRGQSPDRKPFIIAGVLIAIIVAGLYFIPIIGARDENDSVAQLANEQSAPQNGVLDDKSGQTQQPPSTADDSSSTNSDSSSNSSQQTRPPAQPRTSQDTVDENVGALDKLEIPDNLPSDLSEKEFKEAVSQYLFTRGIKAGAYKVYDREKFDTIGSEEQHVMNQTAYFWRYKGKSSDGVEVKFDVAYYQDTYGLMVMEDSNLDEARENMKKQEEAAESQESAPEPRLSDQSAQVEEASLPERILLNDGDNIARALGQTAADGLDVSLDYALDQMQIVAAADASYIDSGTIVASGDVTTFTIVLSNGTQLAASFDARSEQFSFNII